jgi:acyl-CoA thioester hydrolase
MGLAPFQYDHRVSYAECTAGNHIYYSRYLDLLEAARGEFFRQLGAPLLQLEQQDIIFPVVECRVRYQAAARYDDLLMIELWPFALKGARLNFACRIRNQLGVQIIEAETFHACTGRDEKPRRIPGELEELLQPYLRAELAAAGASEDLKR